MGNRQIEFTAHNIRLDDGTQTNPQLGETMDRHPWFLAARRMLNVVIPGNRHQMRIADLGCLEGGYSVEFARLGFQVVGLEVRESNMAACRFVKERTNLENLEFVRDDAWNLAKYGTFDCAFCCGLFYHLDRPRQFLELLSLVTRRLLIIQTHFATDRKSEKFQLSELTEHDGLQGRWYTEYADEKSFRNRENLKWASWDNRRSFWVKRESLLQSIQDVGFDIVMEQFDSLGHDISGTMTDGYYRKEDRGTFIGIKTVLQ